MNSRHDFLSKAHDHHGAVLVVRLGGIVKFGRHARGKYSRDNLGVDEERSGSRVVDALYDLLPRRNKHKHAPHDSRRSYWSMDKDTRERADRNQTYWLDRGIEPGASWFVLSTVALIAIATVGSAMSLGNPTLDTLEGRSFDEEDHGLERRVKLQKPCNSKYQNCGDKIKSVKKPKDWVIERSLDDKTDVEFDLD
ncbi:hypothetical protein DACRYDRAFT_108958 [Dacryopinax primogenitus]|uniref:Uncharacterized protein n=1 Tax=Dacryopinax primogenitus (strain DJM 731) TaxID=1858805 RepID=M5FS84_DACPD|nr:uncharacterized protein DACRYDRAFT_108958 [Dacryopinax primogenitus]EJU00211.1 hypothetical protein DACRYDRAFT_108958 [Dacryopinax primogenitus]